MGGQDGQERLVSGCSECSSQKNGRPPVDGDKMRRSGTCFCEVKAQAARKAPRTNKDEKPWCSVLAQ
jgi:hypothetical protein